jgi:hypothetical protein
VHLDVIEVRVLFGAKVNLGREDLFTRLDRGFERRKLVLRPAIIRLVADLRLALGCRSLGERPHHPPDKCDSGQPSPRPRNHD